MAIYKEFAFIPAGRQGILVYKISIDTKELAYKGLLYESIDVRDLSLMYLSKHDKLIAMVADHEEGLLMLEINVNTLEDDTE